jgi:hypothetical protein
VEGYILLRLENETDVNAVQPANADSRISIMDEDVIEVNDVQ